MDASRRLSDSARDALVRVSTATLTTQLLERGLRNTFIAGLRPSRPDLRMLGFAFTLRYAPAREDIGSGSHYDNSSNVQRIAVERVQADDVLVIDARSQRSAASFGHIIATRIARRGAAGLVTDGALRDSPSFAQLDLPVYYAAAHATTSAVLHHPVDINVPIGCGEVLVVPGDVIVGDAEGVVVVPYHLVEEVALGAREQEALEEFALEHIRDGAPIADLYPLAPERREAYEAWRETRAAQEDR